MKSRRRWNSLMNDRLTLQAPGPKWRGRPAEKRGRLGTPMMLTPNHPSVQVQGYPVSYRGNHREVRAGKWPGGAILGQSEARCIPRGLKPAYFCGPKGTAERFAEKVLLPAGTGPQALKRGHGFNDIAARVNSCPSRFGECLGFCRRVCGRALPQISLYSISRNALALRSGAAKTREVSPLRVPFRERKGTLRSR